MLPVTDTPYPQPIAPVGHVEPVPRRIRALRDGRTVIDTTHALYVWEWPFYPQYLLPVDAVAPDVRSEAIESEHGRTGYLRFAWDAFDAWLEEDEEVYVHPRNPYVRVDALRSSRTVRIELAGVVLAESSAPVMVFETGLPTRYYFDRTAVDLTHLRPSDTQTPCPYKGRTSAYWSVLAGGAEHADLAWSYDYPSRQLLPIAGLIAFLNEKVDVFLDGEPQPRPSTHFGD